MLKLCTNVRAANGQSLAGSPACDSNARVPLLIFWMASSTRETCRDFGTNSCVPAVSPTNLAASLLVNSDPRSDFNRQTSGCGSCRNFLNSSISDLNVAIAVATAAGVLPRKGMTNKHPVASSTPTNIKLCCTGLFGNGPHKSTSCLSPGTEALSSRLSSASSTLRCPLTFAFALKQAGHFGLYGS